MFSIGRNPPPQKGKPRYRKDSNHGPSFAFKKSWLLIPRAHLTPYQYIILSGMKPDFLTVWLAAYSLEEVYSESSREYIFLRAFYPSNLTFAEIQEQVKEAFERNQTLRFQFKRLLNAWRFRHVEFVNTVDVVTQEEIQKPVRIYDWALRKGYAFEAATILRDSTLRLLNHNCLMMESLPPRNILTNMKFTEGQCIAVSKQMQAHGITNAHWECFAKSKFSIQKLLYTYEVPMRLELLQGLFKQYSWDAADLLLDFIDEQYRKANELVPDENLCIAVFKRHWSDSYVSSWISLCKEDWAARIRPHSHTEAFKAYIQGKAGTLIQSETTWYTLLKKKK